MNLSMATDASDRDLTEKGVTFRAKVIALKTVTTVKAWRRKKKLLDSLSEIRSRTNRVTNRTYLSSCEVIAQQHVGGESGHAGDDHHDGSHAHSDALEVSRPLQDTALLLSNPCGTPNTALSATPLHETDGARWGEVRGTYCEHPGRRP